MLGTATVSCPSVFGPFILSRSSSRSSTDRTKAVPHLLLRELRGEVLEKLPPRLEIALHCNEHSRRNVLTAKKAGPGSYLKTKQFIILLLAERRDQSKLSSSRPLLAIGNRKSKIANVIVPVVQRIERRFPKAKTAFLQEFADVVRSAQTAVSEYLE